MMEEMGVAKVVFAFLCTASHTHRFLVLVGPDHERQKRDSGGNNGKYR